METKKTSEKNLENKKFIFLELGIIISLAVVLFAFEYRSDRGSIVDTFVYPEEINDMDEVLPIFIPQQAISAPKPVNVMPLNSFILVDEAIDLSETLEIIDSELNTSPGQGYTTTVGYDDTGEDMGDGDVPFHVVEVMPRFKGNLNVWLRKNLRYPPEAEIHGIGGKVYVQFIIEKDGSISQAETIGDIDPLLIKEALRVVNSMPKWEPGKQRDKNVRVRFTLPIVFRTN